jgi:exopolyphosphatase/pppGpp-phosphohydrolase
LFGEIIKILGFSECIVVDDGLREGVAIAGCTKFSHTHR